VASLHTRSWAVFLIYLHMGKLSLPPGFRFHPTDEELVSYYLKRKVNGRKIEFDAIGDVDLYKFEPWDLPGMLKRLYICVCVCVCVCVCIYVY
jgi:hypothetical protein